MKRILGSLIVLVALLAILELILPGMLERHINKVVREPPYSVSSQTLAFQQSLFIADLHADSLLWQRNLARQANTGHIDIPRLQQANVGLQVFSVVTTAPRHLNINRNSDSSDLVEDLAMAELWPPRTWFSPKQRALYQARRLQHLADTSNGRLILIRTQPDLKKFVQERGESQGIAAVLASEGSQPLEGNLQSLDELFAAGFRIMSPTHFTDTTVGGSASGVSKKGLTQLGRDWVREMERKQMLIDLAHSSSATLGEVTRMAIRPVIVSHTGVKGTCNNNRNLSDDELRAVARTGGVIGIGYWETATCGSDANAVARAIRYAVNVVGVDHVALGSDFDGGTTEPFDVRGLPLLTEALLRAGFSRQEIAMIMGGNVVRLFMQNLPE